MSHAAGHRPGELGAATPFPPRPKGLKGLGRAKLYLELYWGDRRIEVEAYQRRRPLVARADPAAPFPLWGFTLPKETDKQGRSAFQLARRSDKGGGYALRLLPAATVERRAAGAMAYEPLAAVSAQRILELSEGETARLTEGSFTLVARVGRPPDRVWVNPVAGAPWLLLVLLALLGGGGIKLVSMVPEHASSDFQVTGVPDAVVRLIAPPPPEKKERLEKQLAELKKRAPKAPRKEKAPAAPEAKVAKNLPKAAPAKTRAISALAKLTASSATTDILSASANPLATGKPNGQANKLAALIGTGPGPSKGVIGLGLGTTGGGGTVGGGELLRGKGGIGGLAVGSVGKGGVGGTVTRASTREVGTAGSGGTIDKAAVAKVINQNLHQVQSCYERGLHKTPGLAGKVHVEWAIATTGKVVSVKTRNSTLGSASVEGCILNAIKGWQFPKAKGGNVIISYPFVFNAVGF